MRFLILLLLLAGCSAEPEQFSEPACSVSVDEGIGQPGNCSKTVITNTAGNVM